MAREDDWRQIRGDSAQKLLRERAAAASHPSVSAFVLRAPALYAEHVLSERSVIALSPGAAEAFDEALCAPAAVNSRLATALDRPRAFRWAG
ncbi:MAG: DUF1778 domain-containing protein [Solirubrobacteraceae bacterium]